MKIDSSNIEFLLFEKQEGNLSAAEQQELDLFLLNHPEWMLVEEEWNESLSFLKAPTEDYQLTGVLQQSVVNHQHSLRWMYASLILSAGLLIAATAWLLHKPLYPLAGNAKRLTSGQAPFLKYQNLIKKEPTSIISSISTPAKFKTASSPPEKERLTQHMEAKVEKEIIPSQTETPIENQNITSQTEGEKIDATSKEVLNTNTTPSIKKSTPAQKTKVSKKIYRTGLDPKFQETNTNF
ncbi:MAG: hypothetical protein MUF42_12055 [Cytophagaceae bacterium]|jgi:hypothetical protein|nr:hypothetical protein [Cytophagaceae bacterium]